jgi:hypothetical protein
MSTTWYDVEQAIYRWAKDEWLAGYYTNDSADEWAHYTADGCEYTIYYHHQIDLWRDSDYVRSFEDMAFGIEDIQDRMQACVYYAIYEACLNAASDVIMSEGTFTYWQENRVINAGGERIIIPVLAYEYR